MHRGRGEAHGAAAFHGVGKSQTLPAAVQAGRGEQPSGEAVTQDPPAKALTVQPLETLKALLRPLQSRLEAVYLCSERLFYLRSTGLCLTASQQVDGSDHSFRFSALCLSLIGQKALDCLKTLALLCLRRFPQSELDIQGSTPSNGHFTLAPSPRKQNSFVPKVSGQSGPLHYQPQSGRATGTFTLLPFLCGLQVCVLT